MASTEREAYSYIINYGKMSVPFYRVYAAPLEGITSIPESPFRGKENTLFAAEVDVEVSGSNFLPSYTQGDNSNVVATDSMKNFILKHALTFEGSTLEGFLNELGHNFLQTYPQMEQLRLTARELPFTAVPVPKGGQARAGEFEPSSVLYSRTHDDYTMATLDFARTREGIALRDHRVGRVGLQLLKVTGSAFTHFVRDDYTTLPERGDRPLFVYMNVYWRYATVGDLLDTDHARYVAAEQVRDFVQVVFHEFVSESIQHLVHEMGTRLLARFPQLSEVSFEAQNRTRDPMASSESDPKVKVYSDPFPAYGLIKLTISRNT